MNKEYKCSPKETASKFNDLMHAVMKKDIEKIKTILQTDYNQINQVNSKGWTPLMLAVRNARKDSSEECVELLINAGADLNIQNNTGATALMLAVAEANTESSEKCVEMLILAGANLNLARTTDKSTALMLAVSFAKTDSTEKCVQMLIAANAELNLKTKDNRSALMIAVYRIDTGSTEECIQMLIDAGAVIDDVIKNNIYVRLCCLRREFNQRLYEMEARLLNIINFEKSKNTFQFQNPNNMNNVFSDTYQMIQQHPQQTNFQIPFQSSIEPPFPLTQPPNYQFSSEPSAPEYHFPMVQLDKQN
jgi:ankyrin repeat protein